MPRIQASDGLLVILTPQAMTDPDDKRRRCDRAPPHGKPVIASWMGGADVAAGEAILNRAGIPTYPIRTQPRACSRSCGATPQPARAV